MSSISQKLYYLQKTKDEIFHAINDMGVEVTSEDPFRSYAGKISQIEGPGTGEVTGLQVTENGVYTAEEGSAYSPVRVMVNNGLLGETEVTAKAATDIEAMDTVYFVRNGSSIIANLANNHIHGVKSLGYSSLNVSEGTNGVFRIIFRNELWEDITSDAGVTLNYDEFGYNNPLIFDIQGTSAVAQVSIDHKHLYFYSTDLFPWLIQEYPLELPSEHCELCPSLYQVGNILIVFYRDINNSTAGCIIINFASMAVSRIDNLDYSHIPYTSAKTSLTQYGNRIGFECLDASSENAIAINLATSQIERIVLAGKSYSTSNDISWISETDFVITDGIHYPTVQIFKFRVNSTNSQIANVVWQLDIGTLFPNNINEYVFGVFVNHKYFFVGQTQTDIKLYYLEGIEENTANSISIHPINSYPDGFILSPDMCQHINLSPDRKKLLLSGGANNVLAMFDVETFVWNVLNYTSLTYPNAINLNLDLAIGGGTILQRSVV